jgi:hypothetical protein
LPRRTADEKPNTLTLVFMDNLAVEPGRWEVRRDEIAIARRELLGRGLRVRGLFHSDPLAEAVLGVRDRRNTPTEWVTLTGKEARSMNSKTFKATIFRDGAMCFIPLGFDPKTVFGRVRAPVRVTLNGYTYRSTIAAMGGPPCIPLRKSNREAAGLEGGVQAKKPETRARRIERATRMLRLTRKYETAGHRSHEA